MAAPWDQTVCPGLQPIKDLHWQHTAVAESAKTAVKADPHVRRSMHSSADGSAMPSTVVPEQSSAVLATPAPAMHVSISSCSMPVSETMHLQHAILAKFAKMAKQADFHVRRSCGQRHAINCGSRAVFSCACYTCTSNACKHLQAVHCLCLDYAWTEDLMPPLISDCSLLTG